MNIKILLFTALFFILLLWLLPITLGIKTALNKNRSTHWMWLGGNPILGWITYTVLNFLSELIECRNCGKKFKNNVKSCPHLIFVIFNRHTKI
ncbi:MAG: hypothetical protein A2015_05150 [Spirochaetes bacterium GWF1_31_7]|nr:MAG: hypothetical protein A2Y30_06545 [Spirochaetes bacterium GWE1_32_154]OHD47231.1 MAG: hypothetical protein A2015_05150 [Spirochaetes bacterium GWF1_31_7]OHD80928.1 MAG: hypothetical protein A2355_00565 [Spirochaetes bacterium RIFOXYB1_FULL_32_8]HBD94291.1 hypothetical protein [Spirochaetia bacterium]HBI36176.1 hypothetical protein [Spirochaetia bacterium]